MLIKASVLSCSFLFCCCNKPAFKDKQTNRHTHTQHTLTHSRQPPKACCTLYNFRLVVVEQNAPPEEACPFFCLYHPVTRELARGLSNLACKKRGGNKQPFTPLHSSVPPAACCGIDGFIRKRFSPFRLKNSSTKGKHRCLRVCVCVSFYNPHPSLSFSLCLYAIIGLVLRALLLTILNGQRKKG